jgi:acetyltransferase-like isoleucine patch superfamily enzyme
MEIFRNIARVLFFLKYRKRFKYLDFHSTIISPLRIDGIENISIAKNVCIQYKTWLAAVPLAGSTECVLEIGEGSVIGNFNHIYATGIIKIGKNVLTADKVYISDNSHNYSDVNVPVIYQPVKQIGYVEIGDGCWLGENVCIIGVKIGRNCVIGANSVVVNDIPDYCVAVGVPAKIIKQYNAETNRWEKTV